jgi:hypothetical protein
MNTKSQHISFAVLVDLADRKATADDPTASHISDCASCSTELHRLEGLIILMKEDNSIDVPRDVMAQAINAFARRADSSEPSLLQRVIATLTFDSMTPAPAFGVRSTQTGPRQLLYSAAGSDVDLRITKQDDGRWAVAGQVLGGDCSGGEIQLEGETETALTALNDMCEFTLPAVAPGNYRFLLRLANIEVEVPRLEIGL